MEQRESVIVVGQVCDLVFRLTEADYRFGLRPREARERYRLLSMVYSRGFGSR